MKILESLVMIGPGRRSERPVLDQLLEFETAELEDLCNDSAASRIRLLDHLRATGLTPTNAMQAMTAALEFGADLRVVRDALTGFTMGIETTPGPLNFHYGLGFPVVMDFVQTIDGMRRFCQFAGALKIEGTRILVISVLGRHDDDTIRGFARYAASAFDYFVCRNYGFTFKRDQDEIPNLLRDQLLKEGVDDTSITIIHNDTEAMDAALGMTREGDLVAIMCGHEFQKYWQEISSFRERSQQIPGTPVQPLGEPG